MLFFPLITLYPVFGQGAFSAEVRGQRAGADSVYTTPQSLFYGSCSLLVVPPDIATELQHVLMAKMLEEIGVRKAASSSAGAFVQNTEWIRCWRKLG